MKVRVVSTKDKNTGDHHKERYGGVSRFDEHLARLCRTHMSMRGNATDLCRR